MRTCLQGAYRMRGIGKGQRIHLYIIPEVKKLVDNHVAQSGPKNIRPFPELRQMLVDVAAWLMINSFRSENIQLNMVCLQNLRNVWRKYAFEYMMKAYDQIGRPNAPALEFLQNCVV